jgi:hypothetical protein
MLMEKENTIKDSIKMKDGIQKEKRKKKKQDPNLVGQA